MIGRFTRLGELSVHSANVQEGQIVLGEVDIGLEEQARATAEAACKRGATFVDVAYFDPYVKRARIVHAEQNGAHIRLWSPTIDADENAEVLNSLAEIGEGARRLGELALVDGEGRVGPLDTVFYNTLLDENASTHIALGGGFLFLIDDEDRGRGNVSARRIDFMIGSAELEVDGVTADGERVPVLRNLTWQLS